MDWEAKFESNLFKIYCGQVSIFISDPIEPDSFIYRSKREDVVPIIPNTGASETGPLLNGASGVDGLAVIARS